LGGFYACSSTSLNKGCKRKKESCSIYIILFHAPNVCVSRDGVNKFLQLKLQIFRKKLIFTKNGFQRHEDVVLVSAFHLY